MLGSRLLTPYVLKVVGWKMTQLGFELRSACPPRGRMEINKYVQLAGFHDEGLRPFCRAWNC